MGYKKLGIATCVGLIRESRMLARVLRSHGFEVYGIACKAGMVRKDAVGIQASRPNAGCNMCNPILQAKMLEHEGAELNIVVGLLVGSASMYYVNMSMFFAFATLYPDLQFLLFFIIPVKAKWLAWIDAAYFAIAIFQYLAGGHILMALIPIVAVLNYLLFFASDIGNMFSTAKRQAQWKSAQRPNHRQYGGPKVVNFNNAKTQTKENYLHRCAVCGKTDVSHPQMEFRYCSRCNGYYCYCAEHINTHIHIQ